ncbi:zinc transporter ZIP1-like [Dendronephthya gigantea]|uniref:zinc transporter ZIP1-like n=1 Tax=Dendronephthya gigantea TaxID=151771 RepID=UPI00106CA82E|nr:zinc transporter ZIP1-like [Dendronephthya gigantea]
MHSVVVKIISLSVLFVVTFVAGLLPLTLRQKRSQSDPNRRALRDRKRKQVISLCTCFAGGAFFASSMLELLPAVEKDFKVVLENAKIDHSFPLAEFGISIGFFLILTVEQIIHVAKERPSHGHGHSHTHNHRDSTASPLLHNGHTPSYGTRTPDSQPSPSENDSGESDNDEPPPIAQSPPVPLVNDSHIEHRHVQSTEHNQINDDHDHDHEHSIFAEISKKHHNERHYLRSYLLLIALSVHALFEGLAVGLFEDINNMFQVLGALVIHKCILAFSIGINLVQHSFPAPAVIKSSFLFSAMSPVGFGIGILMLTYASTNLGRIFSALFQALATGTFLYVTFFEIFFHELNSKECHKLLKVLMMILGYALIAIVQYIENLLK